MRIGEVIGWTLVHSVWQIAAIALLFFLVGHALRTSSANARYLAALIALAVCAVAPILTGMVISNHHTSTPTVSISPATTSTTTQTASSNPSPQIPAVDAKTVKSVGHHIEPYLPALVVCWLIGLACMALRLIGALYMLGRIRKKATQVVEKQWQSMLASVSANLRLKQKVSLLVTDEIATPAVVGFFKAAILFPTAALTRLSPEDVEALFAHELAHILRHDYLVNLLQSVVEAILFYHPAVWWISGVIRAEREHCCDDLAVKALGNKEQYARALFTLEHLRQSAPQLAMAANQGQLLARITRIIMPTPRRLTTASASAWVTLALVLAITAGLTGTLHAKQTANKVGKHIGHVIDANGKPVEGATVLFQAGGYTTPTSPLEESVTDVNGDYIAPNSNTPGPSQVVVYKPGVGLGLPEIHGTAPNFHTLVRLMPVQKIHIRAVDATGAPVAGVTIGPKYISTNSNFAALFTGSALYDKFSCKTDDEGRGVLENLPATAYIYLGVTEENYLIKQSTANVHPPRKATEYTLVVEPAGTVEGVVTQNGHPLPNVAIHATCFKENHGSVAFTDQSGHFLLQHQPIGTVTVQATQINPLNKKWAGPIKDVQVKASSTAHVELVFAPGIAVRVKLVNPKGQAMPNTHVMVVGPTPNGSFETSGNTDKNGVFECQVPPGRHKAVIREWDEEASVDVTAEKGAYNLYILHAPIDEPDVRLVCKVLDASGHPSPGKTVQITHLNLKKQPVTIKTHTNQDGEVILHLPESQAATAWAQSGPTKAKAQKGTITLHLS